MSHRPTSRDTQTLNPTTTRISDVTNVTNNPVNNTLRAIATTPTEATAVSMALVHPYACRMSPRLK